MSEGDPIDYLSDDWFLAVRSMLGSCPVDVPSPGAFVVEYVLDDAPEGCARLHTQVFADEAVVAWQPGLSGRADLTIRRTHAMDRDDLLGRGLPDATAEATQLQSIGVPRGDLFGLGREVRLERRLPPGLEISFGVRCPDSAFGAVDAEFVLRGDRIARLASRGVDFMVIGLYADVVAWLHEPDQLLGHRIVCPEYGTTVSGDYFRMSAAEGCVSAGASGARLVHARRLVTYARCRRSPEFVACVDELEERTK